MSINTEARPKPHTCRAPGCGNWHWGMRPYCWLHLWMLTRDQRRALDGALMLFVQDGVAAEPERLIAECNATIVAATNLKRPGNGHRCRFDECRREGQRGHGFCAKHWKDVPAKERAEYLAGNRSVETIIDDIYAAHSRHARRDNMKLRQIFPGSVGVDSNWEPLHLDWYVDKETSGFPPGVNGLGWPPEEI